MDARVNGENYSFYSPGAADLSGMGRRGFEWDLNDWNWDGDMFVATPSNAASSSCKSKQLFPIPANEGLNSSSSCPDAADIGRCDKGKGEMEKRRRIIVMEGDDSDDEGGFPALKLGGHVYPLAMEDVADWDRNNGKRSKVQSSSLNRGTCQVEHCGADLSDAKDYHKRHKVCEMHAKAGSALVGNAVQRFCQQCSKFHLLQEFDEGKRSCRRRLAGHNKRRRKTNPHTIGRENALMDGQDSSSLLISLLKVLSNLQSSSSEETQNKDLICHFVRNLANLAGSFDAKNSETLLEASQDPKKVGNSAGPSSMAASPSHCGAASESLRPLNCSTSPNCTTEVRDCSRDHTNVIAVATPAEIPQTVNVAEHPLVQNLQGSQCQISSNILTGEHPCPTKTGALNSLQQDLPGDTPVQKIGSTVALARLKSFDLNNIYEGNEDDSEEFEKVRNSRIVSPNSPSWMPQECYHSSPPQTSGNSDSSSAKSLASSNGDDQSQTDRIVFKLFGKDPNDFPLLLRAQIVDWLSNTPTDIESYIKPGCIILTMYLRLPESTWEKICCNLSSSLRRLLDLAQDDFWRTGWVYARVQQQMAFIYNGQCVLDTPFLLSSHNDCKILSVTPIAVPISGSASFIIKGFNLAQSTMRLLCAFGGKYLVQETTSTLVDYTDTSNVKDGLDCLSFTCSLPNVVGRGFVEVEDYGLSGAFFPFIVAEPDVCSEIRMLESTINMALSNNNFQEKSTEMHTRTQALEFLYEMGWLLRRFELRSRAAHSSSQSHPNDFSLTRFNRLMKFSMEHEWCAIVKKLLDIFVGGSVDVGDGTAELALEKMALLHCAVEKNSMRMVEFLLRYVPNKPSGLTGSQNLQANIHPEIFLFRPDKPGPFGMTPLHFAASRSNTERLLDALTSDPGQAGIIAWNNARDDTLFTPADYARSRGFKSYIDLVEQKIINNSIVKHVVLDIHGSLPAPEDTQKLTKNQSPSKPTGFQVKVREHRPAQQRPCKACSRQQLAYVNRNRPSLLYRPVMLLMVGIAAVCVCVGIIFKGPPEVSYLSHPFRWDLLSYGSI